MCACSFNMKYFRSAACLHLLPFLTREDRRMAWLTADSRHHAVKSHMCTFTISSGLACAVQTSCWPVLKCLAYHDDLWSPVQEGTSRHSYSRRSPGCSIHCWCDGMPWAESVRRSALSGEAFERLLASARAAASQPQQANDPSACWPLCCPALP